MRRALCEYRIQDENEQYGDFIVVYGLTTPATRCCICEKLIREKAHRMFPGSARQGNAQIGRTLDAHKFMIIEMLRVKVLF